MSLYNEPDSNTYHVYLITVATYDFNFTLFLVGCARNGFNIIEQRVAQTQGLNLDPMGTLRLSCLRPEEYLDG